MNKTLKGSGIYYLYPSVLTSAPECEVACQDKEDEKDDDHTEDHQEND